MRSPNSRRPKRLAEELGPNTMIKPLHWLSQPFVIYCIFVTPTQPVARKHYQWIVTRTVCYWVINPAALHTTAENCGETWNSLPCSGLCGVSEGSDTSSHQLVCSLLVRDPSVCSKLHGFFFPSETPAIYFWSHKYSMVVDKFNRELNFFLKIFTHSFAQSFSSISMYQTQGGEYTKNKYLS